MNKSEINELYKIMFQDYPDIVTIPQLQKMLGISRHISYELIKREFIPAVIIGKSYKIPKIGVIKFVLEADRYKDILPVSRSTESSDKTIG